MSVQTSLKPRGRTAPRAGRLWLCVLVGAMSPASMGRAQSASTPDVPAVVLNALRSRVIVSGLRPPSSTVLTIQHPESLITSLGDPYARLLSPPAFQQFRSASGVAYGGIGARIVSRQDTVWITRVFPGSPAERSGLRPLDRVVAINDHTTIGWSTGMAVEKLRGPIGSSLTLLVVRGGNQEPMPVTVRRGRVRIPSVQAAMVDASGIGIVHLATFGGGAAADVRHAVDSLVGAGMKGMILDLRANPGGLMSEAIDIVRLFVDEGQLITEVRGRPHVQPIRFNGKAPDTYPILPIIVLVGPTTASASEIVAAALQDHERAGILGTRSYGKGSVQQIFSLPRRWSVKLTTARWYRPSGRTLDRVVLHGPPPAPASLVLQGGVTPDVLLADSMRLTAQRMVESFADRWPRVSAALLGEVSMFLDSATTVSPDMVIPPAALEGLLDTLIYRDQIVSPENRIPVQRWLADRLSHLVVSVRWGQTAGTLWRYERDVQIVEASALLRNARSPADLVASMRGPSTTQVAEGTGDRASPSPGRLLEFQQH